MTVNFGAEIYVRRTAPNRLFTYWILHELAREFLWPFTSYETIFGQAVRQKALHQEWEQPSNWSFYFGFSKFRVFRDQFEVFVPQSVCSINEYTKEAFRT